MQLSDDEILWDVEEEHLREAEFLVEIREAAIDAPHYSLKEVEVGPEERLLAHVDALVVGGPAVAERLLISTIEDEDEEYETIVAATLALFSSGSDDLRRRTLAVLDQAEEPEQRRGVTRGLQLCDDPRIDAWLVNSLSSATSTGRAARLEALAGRSFAAGAWLQGMLVDEDIEVVRAAAWLARFSPEPSVLAALAPLARAEDAELRRRTLESALCRQLPGAWESAVYWAFCPGDSPFRRDALTWVAMLGDAAANDRVLGLVDQPEHRVDALWAIGFGGRVSAVDRCMELLGDEEIGPLAGEVVCAIAGLSTAEDRYWRDRADADEDDALPELEDDDLDEDLVPGGASALPVPDPEAIATWWDAHRGEFEPGVRHLGGQPLDRDRLIAALTDAPMRRRHMLALELEVLTGGAVVVNTRALVRVQRAQLAGLAGLARLDLQRGLALR